MHAQDPRRAAVKQSHHKSIEIVDRAHFGLEVLQVLVFADVILVVELFVQIQTRDELITLLEVRNILQSLNTKTLLILPHLPQ